MAFGVNLWATIFLPKDAFSSVQLVLALDEALTPGFCISNDVLMVVLSIIPSFPRQNPGHGLRR